MKLKLISIALEVSEYVFNTSPTCITYFCPDIYSNELPGGIDTSFARVIFEFVPPPAFEVDESINNVTFALVASLFAAKIPRITVASTPV